MNDLIVLDFDGVLAIPYTNPEEHYPQIPEIIKKLHKKYILAVASFNPLAKEAIMRWGLSEYFIEIKTIDLISIEQPLKSKQIDEIIKKITPISSHKTIRFFDDTYNNILEVKMNKPHINSFLVNNNFGLTQYDLDFLGNLM